MCAGGACGSQVWRVKQTKPQHLNLTLAHSTPSKKIRSLARPNSESTTKPDLSPEPSVADQSRSQPDISDPETTDTKRIPQDEHRNVINMQGVMMLLTFTKVHKGDRDVNLDSVRLPASGKYTLKSPGLSSSPLLPSPPSPPPAPLLPHPTQPHHPTTHSDRLHPRQPDSVRPCIGDTA